MSLFDTMGLMPTVIMTIINWVRFRHKEGRLFCLNRLRHCCEHSIFIRFTSLLVLCYPYSTDNKYCIGRYLLHLLLVIFTGITNRMTKMSSYSFNEEQQMIKLAFLMLLKLMCGLYWLSPSVSAPFWLSRLKICGLYFRKIYSVCWTSSLCAF